MCELIELDHELLSKRKKEGERKRETENGSAEMLNGSKLPRRSRFRSLGSPFSTPTSRSLARSLARPLPLSLLASDIKKKRKTNKQASGRTTSRSSTPTCASPSTRASSRGTACRSRSVREISLSLFFRVAEAFFLFLLYLLLLSISPPSSLTHFPPLPFLHRSSHAWEGSSTRP